MEKNVGSVDIEELKRARESLNEERGLENDPNMYSNYNPNRNLQKQDADTLIEPNNLSQTEENSSFEETSTNSETIENHDENLVNDSNEYETQSADALDLSQFEVAESNVVNEKSELNADSNNLSGDSADNLSDINATSTNYTAESNSNNDYSSTNKVNDSDFDVSAFLDSIDLGSTTTTEPNAANTNQESANSSENSSNLEDNEDKIDFSVYDSFAEFEIKNYKDYLAQNGYIVNDNVDSSSDNINAKSENLNTDANADSLENNGNRLTGATEESKETDIAAEQTEVSAHVSEAENQTALPEENVSINESSVNEESEVISANNTENSSDLNISAGNSEEETKSQINSTEETLAENDNMETEADAQKEEYVKLTQPKEDITEESKTAEINENNKEMATAEDNGNINLADENLVNFSEDYEDVETEPEDYQDSSKLIADIVGTMKKQDTNLVKQEEDKVSLNNKAYKQIKSYNFIDALQQESFKKCSKLSFIFGKDEKDRYSFMNIKDMYNTAVFGSNEQSIYSFVCSMLISLELKNSVNDINFVICDSKVSSDYEIFNKSSYLFFNRIAKTNREIYDSLSELENELELRYGILADSGCKNIEEYNKFAAENKLSALPYILLIYSNYNKSCSISLSEQINISLSNLLKLGRIVGMYFIIITNDVIEHGSINYNLSGRIAFKTDLEEMSLYEIGSNDATLLLDEEDFVYTSVNDDEIYHLKVAKLNKKQVELLIENIEK